MVAAGGIPEALATGAGEGSNKHTLEELMIFTSGIFQMIRNNITEAFESTVSPILESTEGLSGDITLEWEQFPDNKRKEG